MSDVIEFNYEPSPPKPHTEQSEARIKLFNELNTLIHPIKIPMDGLMALATRRWEIDFFKLDKLFTKADREYNDSECTYKGEPCSMNEYVTKKFGNRASEIIDLLCQ